MQTDEQRRASKKAHDRAYYLAHRAEILARVAQRYHADPKPIKDYARSYAQQRREEIARRLATKWQKDLEANRAAGRERGAEARTRMSTAQRAARNAQNRAWHHANRDNRLAQKREWATAHPEKGASYATQRRAAKLHATPAWANSFFIDEAYDIAMKRTEVTGTPWEVDHEVPLISPIVCGLHVEHNLRVIPRVVNRRKSNRHWPDMP